MATQTIAASVTATAQSILLPMIRQVYPQVLAHQILNVQPLTWPAGEIFSLRVMYTDPNIEKFHKKYKFSRAKWYYCSFKFADDLKCHRWCTEHFGPLSNGGDAWMRWRLEACRARFLNEDDAIMFKLRWAA